MFGGVRQVDRAGTREGKKTSLRKTGKDKKIASADKLDENLTRTELPIPFNKDNVIIDCGGNLVNRNLEAESSRVIARAITSGVGGMVIVTNSFEKSESSIAMCKANPGVVYAVVGIHPSNISAKKMSDRLFLQLMHDLKKHAISQHVVGLYAGLDYERDYGLKFPQEKFMKAQIQLSQELNLPMVLQDLGNGDGILEVMKDSRKNFNRGMIYSFNGNPDLLRKYIQLDFYIGFSGQLADDTDQGSQLREYITVVPQNRILLVSDAPNYTPQNIPDQFIRESKNEPSNLSYILPLVAQILKMELPNLKELLLNNSKEFYSLSPESINNDNLNTTTGTDTTNTSTTTTTTTSTNKDTNSDSEDSDSEQEDNNNKLKEFTDRLSKLDKKKLQYCCKKCRSHLFKFEDIIEHEEQIKVLDSSTVSTKKKSKKDNNNTSTNNSNSSGCKSLFVNRDRFKIDTTKNNIKVECQKCNSKLGSYSNMDEQCSCGKKEMSVCRIIKSRIEAVLLDANGQQVDISSLNINSDDDMSDSDSDDQKKSKKKKAKKTNIKKDNKRNLSSYRNKSDVPSTKASKSSKSQQPPSLFSELSDESESEDESSE